jgi:hypothetical protein
MDKKPLKKPPYAADVKSNGAGVWLFFGSPDAWQRVKNGHSAGRYNVMLLPPGEAPEDFDWSCVAGLSLVVIEMVETSHDLRKRLARQLALYGADGAIVIPKSLRTEEYVFWDSSGWVPPAFRAGPATVAAQASAQGGAV